MAKHLIINVVTQRALYSGHAALSKANTKWVFTF